MSHGLGDSHEGTRFNLYVKRNESGRIQANYARKSDKTIIALRDLRPHTSPVDSRSLTNPRVFSYSFIFSSCHGPA